MTHLLQKIIVKLQKLPEEQQNMLATRWLAELEDKSLILSAELYAQVYQEDEQLQDLTESALRE